MHNHSSTRTYVTYAHTNSIVMQRVNAEHQLAAHSQLHA
jgi:phage tail protein X